MCGPTQTLLSESEDARVHCAVLNVRPDTGHPTPPDPAHSPRGATPQGSRRYEMQTGPDTEATSPPGSPGGPLPQDPTACLRTGPTTRLRSTHTRSEDQARSTGSPRREPAELVSVPPSSTTPGTGNPSVVTGHRVLSAALDHHRGVPPADDGQRSLERR